MNGTEDAYDDVNDQPVDYSKKYIERNAPPQNRLTNESQTSRCVSKKEFNEHDSKVDLFSDYAETDLDQPTDYSLRYGAEGDTDEEEKQSTEYFPGSEQEDTVKTYCTEGTPYETPFNFSTATSMSDLRDMKENDLLKKVPKKTIEITSKSPVSFIEEIRTIDCDEQDDNMLTKELEEENPKDTVILNPGQVTPEKIVIYYEEEGTLQGFSRANSLNSLNSAVTSQNDITGIISKVDSPPSVNKEELENEDHDALALSNNQIESSSENDNSSENKNSPRVLDKEGKMVTFGGQDYYVEETPLMFSRSSSLGSLSGFEQHSIHDDRSSVISDFSRRTSGIVSPSELPDSPTQTVLSSPRNHKTHNAEFPSKIQEEAVRPSVRHLSFTKPQTVRNSVFEDEIATFKEESTPIEFSGATSLSSLTIDDEVKIFNDSKTYCSEKVSADDEKDIHRLETDMRNVTISGFENKVKEEQVSDGDEDEDMLTACINMGIQTNRYRQSLKSLNSQKSTQLESPSILGSYQRNSIPNRMESHVTPVETPINPPKTNRTTIEHVASDTVHVYCTEDTPADISPIGSLSNLSALSMPSVQEDVEKIEQDKSAEVDCHRNDLFNESANLSDEDEKILNECIQSGMPKARQVSSPVTSSISFVKKSERLSHKFNICGTPSSSPVDTSHGNKNPILNSKLPSESLRYPEEFSDDSPNHSEDEAILTECIQSAMPKAKCSIPSSIRSSPLSQVENSKTMNMRTPSTSSAYFQPRYAEQRETKKVLPFEDNIELSEEEEDIMLAQCIRSGMPKALNSVSTMMPFIHPQTSHSMSSTAKKFEPCSRTTRNFSAPSPFYCANKSCTSRNATPHSSSMYKSMNINIGDPCIRNIPSNFNCFPGRATSSVAHTSGQTLKNGDNGVRERINNSPCCARRSPLRYAESENSNAPVNNICVSVRSRVVKYGAPIFNRTENNDCTCRNTMKSIAIPSRHSLASSPNEEASLISTEEWDLLELCITSGIPRNKYRVKATRPTEGAILNRHDDCEPVPEDNYSVRSYNSYICKR